MKRIKTTKRLPVQVVKTEKSEYSYSKFLWFCIVTAVFLAGNLLSFFAIWEGINIAKAAGVAASFAGVLIMIITDYLGEKGYKVRLFRFMPVIIFVILGPVRCWEGVRVWINQMISGWNQMHEGGVALFAGTSSSGAVTVSVIVCGLLFGELVWYMVSKEKRTFCWIYTIFWIGVMLTGNKFQPTATAFLMTGLFGACMFAYGMPLRKSGVISFLIIFIACIAGALWFTNGNLGAVEETRENVAHSIHELRYGKDQLPEGKLDEADELQKNKQEMMRVIPEQKKTLYLRAYVGSVYRSGVWEKTPDSVYGGENAGILRWLKEKNFDPLTQPAQYQSLSKKKEQSQNHVKVEINKASRYYFYAPASLKNVIKGKSKNKTDNTVISKGIFGQKEYEWTELSSSRPSELIVADDWVSKPTNSAQKEYSEAEAVYRKFVYENYTKADSHLSKQIQQIFWKDYHSKSDGIYSALAQVRTKLKEKYQYTKTPGKTPQGEDPILYFLTKSHIGNQMLYASAAVEAFRVHGIPARYVEGYYLGASKIQESKNGQVSVTGEDAHAWVEVYFDGIGWQAVDVTPGFYYNVATLQKMVNTPEKIKKNAALKNNGYKGRQTADSAKNNRNTGQRVKKAVENTAMILLGIVALLIVTGFILFIILEIRLWIMERKVRKKYEQAEMNEKIQILSKQIFGLLGILGIEVKLGWKTKEFDQKISEHFTIIEAGDYERACELMEKTIYGGIKLEFFEERTVRSFRDKLIEEAKSFRWREKLKLRYQFRKYCM